MRNEKTKLIQYYSAAICKKIDQKADFFVERIDLFRKGDAEKARMMEKRYLEPLEREIRALLDALLRDVYGE